MAHRRKADLLDLWKTREWQIYYDEVPPKEY
jgi:hypothetical protein